MMKIIKINKKQTKGITLIALVVTIVVLLILAAISINLILGDDGILGKASDAKNKWNQAEQNDQAALNSLYGQMENILNGIGNETEENTEDDEEFIPGDTYRIFKYYIEGRCQQTGEVLFKKGPFEVDEWVTIGIMPDDPSLQVEGYKPNYDFFEFSPNEDGYVLQLDYKPVDEAGNEEEDDFIDSRGYVRYYLEGWCPETGEVLFRQGPFVCDKGRDWASYDPQSSSLQVTGYVPNFEFFEWMPWEDDDVIRLPYKIAPGG